MGCPSDGGNYEPRGGYRALADIRLFADKRLGEVEEFMSPELLAGDLAFEGKRGFIADMLRQVSCTVGARYMDDGVAPPEVGPATLPVSAERIAVPEKAGTVDPRDFLDEEKAAVLNNLHALRKPEWLWEDIVRAFHQVPMEEEDRVALRLLESGMAVLLSEDELPRDSRGRLLPGGLFCVPKNEQEDRLIFDRRPENGTMERLHWTQLPSGACFAKLLLGEKEYLRASGDDLRNYYYMLKLPPNWVRFNAVGRRVSQKILKARGIQNGGHYRLAFRVLGMGDKNACDIAQAVHEGVLRRHGVLDPACTLVYGKHVPETELIEGVYLDDLLIAKRCASEEIVPLDGTFTPPLPQVNDRDVIEVAAAEAAYLDAGLRRAEHKAFRFETSFRAWGAEIDGINGRAGSPVQVRRQIWMLLRAIVTGGFCSQEVLRKVLGYLSFAFQFRREFYSLMHHSFRFVDRMAEGKWVHLPRHIADELRSAALHLPFARWNMRRPLSTTLIASDATPSSGGAVAAEVPESIIKALWKHTEVRGEACRLDRPAAFLPDAEVPKEASAFASVVSECLEWRVVSSYHMRQTSHISLQECRAVRKEVMRLAADPDQHGKVFVFLNDSRVVVGAMAKGRSSSFKLNGLLRGMLPHLLFSDMALALLWIETCANLADHPSRFRPLPPPRLAPLWVQRLGLDTSKGKAGLEVFAGTARLTTAHRELGIRMLDPVDILYGNDAFSPEIEFALQSGIVSWIWLAPPCSSFSPLRNLDKGRPPGFPEGREDVPEIARGNALWRRALHLIQIALKAGVFVFLEHPLRSAAWRMRESELILKHDCLRVFHVDFCAYADHTREGSPNQKPTRIVSSAPWFEKVVRRCPGDHWHGPPLRGERAKKAGAYPWGFCRELAHAYQQWSPSLAPATGRLVR